MYQFGVGGMFATPNGGNLATPSGPVQFGVIQDVSLDIDQKLVELRGQSKFPNDVAPSDMSIKGKASFGQIEVEIYNSLFFGNTITPATAVLFVPNEAHSVPASSVYTITVTHTTTFNEDFGVTYAATGAALQPVVSVTAVGQYSVNTSTGVYTFFSGDASAAVLISYTYTPASTTGRMLSVVNEIQGYGPQFELYLLQSYQGANNMRLYACRASKMSAPLKKDGYLLSDFEFQAYANAAGKVFDWSQVSA